MEPLYQLEVTFTYELYESFNRLVLRQRFRWLGILFGCLLALICWTSFLSSDWQGLVWYVSFCALYAVLLYFLRRNSLKKTWQSNLALQNQRLTYEFYDDRVTEASPIGTAVCPYDKLYKVLEDKRIFALMIANNQGMMVPKSACSAELLEMLHGLKERFGKKPLMAR